MCWFPWLRVHQIDGGTGENAFRCTHVTVVDVDRLDAVLAKRQVVVLALSTADVLASFKGAQKRRVLDHDRWPVTTSGISPESLPSSQVSARCCCPCWGHTPHPAPRQSIKSSVLFFTLDHPTAHRGTATAVIGVYHPKSGSSPTGLKPGIPSGQVVRIWDRNAHWFPGPPKPHATALRPRNGSGHDFEAEPPPVIRRGQIAPTLW